MKYLDKDNKLTLILSGIILLLLGVILGILIERSKYNIVNDYNFLIAERQNCKNDIREYTNASGQMVYTYCLEDVKVIEDNLLIGLKDYLQDNDIDKVIKKLELEETIDDGGSKVYQDRSITLIRCNTKDGNKNIYIGSSIMRSEDAASICSKEIENVEFTRTYTIEKILEHDEEEKVYLLLKEYQGERELVIVETEEVLKENKNYEFTFKLSKIFIDDNIKSIFENAEIVSIKETNKKGDKQIQESFKVD